MSVNSLGQMQALRRQAAETNQGVGYILICVVVRWMAEQKGDGISVFDGFKQNMGDKAPIGDSEFGLAEVWRVGRIRSEARRKKVQPGRHKRKGEQTLDDGNRTTSHPYSSSDFFSLPSSLRKSRT